MFTRVCEIYKSCKIKKIVLTNDDLRDIINKFLHSRAMETPKSLKKIEKISKKVLTNERECDRILKLSNESG